MSTPERSRADIREQHRLICLVDCPPDEGGCGQEAPNPCRTPAGTIAAIPHQPRRMAALKAKVLTA
jgi:hypothetical protein